MKGVIFAVVVNSVYQIIQIKKKRQVKEMRIYILLAVACIVTGHLYFNHLASESLGLKMMHFLGIAF